MSEAQIDGDAALLFFFKPVGVLPGERFDQAGFAMIDMSGGADDIGHATIFDFGFSILDYGYFAFAQDRFWISNCRSQIQKLFQRSMIMKIRNQIVTVEDGSQIEEKSVVFDAANDRRIGGAKFLRDGVGAQFLMLHGHDDRRQLLG